MPSKASILTIDPGFSGTGYAAWDYIDWSQPGITEPHSVGIFRPKNKTGEDWVARSFDLGEKLRAVIAELNCHTCFVEMAQLFDSAKGHMCMSEGDIPHLLFLIGVMANVCYYSGTTFVPVSIPEWKGNLPKELVIKRIHGDLGEFFCQEIGMKSHSYDAVGIGLFAQKKWDSHGELRG